MTNTGDNEITIRAGDRPMVEVELGGGGGGMPGPQGPPGPPGQTGPAGPGVAAGGDTGEILAKASPTDFDTEWVPPPQGGGGGGGVPDPGQAPNWYAKGTGRWYRASNAPLVVAPPSTSPVMNQQNNFAPWDNPETNTFSAWALGGAVVGVGGTQTVALALYALNANNMPGVRVLNFDQIAPVVDLTVGTATQLRVGEFSQPITVPAGRYWLSTLEMLSGQTTAATLHTMPGQQDSRITAIPTTSTGLLGAALQRGGATFVDNPSFSANVTTGRLVYLRQA